MDAGCAPAKMAGGSIEARPGEAAGEAAAEETAEETAEEPAGAAEISLQPAVRTWFERGTRMSGSEPTAEALPYRDYRTHASKIEAVP